MTNSKFSGVSVGQVYTDNQAAAYAGAAYKRTLSVTRILNDTHCMCFCEESGVTSRIRMDRMFTDGKPRKYGYNLVTP